MSHPSGRFRRIAETWNAFWFEPGNTLTLGLFRILFACCLYREIATTSARSVFAIEGGFHLPYLEILRPVSERTYELIHLAQYPLVLLLGIGLLTRPAIAGLLTLQGYVFFVDQLNFRNHPYFFLLVLLILLPSPCDESLSVRRVLRRWRGLPVSDDAYMGALEPMTMQRLIQVQLSLVYFFAAVHKINPWYLGGNGLSRYLSNDLMDDFSGDFIHALLPVGAGDKLETFVQQPGNLIVPAVLTVLVELFLVFALWFRRTRLPGIVAGIGLHGGIALLMNIKTFSIATLATYLLFFPPTTIPRLFATWFGEGDEPSATGLERSGSSARSID